jgi:predicted outer membrane repeat protein
VFGGLQASNLTVFASEFSYNTAVSSGGAISATSSSCVGVFHSLFAVNSAVDGGAVSVISSAQVTLLFPLQFTFRLFAPRVQRAGGAVNSAFVCNERRLCVETAAPPSGQTTFVRCAIHCYVAFICSFATYRTECLSSAMEDSELNQNSAERGGAVLVQSRSVGFACWF